MMCQHGLWAFRQGSTSQLGVGCRSVWRTGNLVGNAVFSKFETLHQVQASRNFGEIVLKRRMSCLAGVWISSPDTRRLPLGVLVVPHRSAGHSKWQNIKHTKQANDGAKAIAFSRLALKLKLAVQEGKSLDPKINSQLAHVVDEAKRSSMPMAKIESIIKSTEGSKDAVLIPFTMEAKGPGGTFIIIELLTDNINRSRSQIKFQLSKLGVAFVDGIRHMFRYKGVVAVDPVPSNLTLETAVDVAIEAGAEDVVEATDDDGTNVLQFMCEPMDFYKVKTALSNRGYALKSSKLAYIPENKVSLNDQYLELMSKIVEILDNRPDVDTFYDNVE